MKTIQLLGTTTLGLSLAVSLLACSSEVDEFVEPAVPDSGDEMKPASMTEGEKLGKADGWDPRDAEPSYAFTAVPESVATLPGEFDPTQLMIVAYSDGAESLKPFFVKLIKAAAPYVSTLVLAESDYSASAFQSDLQYASADLSDVSFEVTKFDTIWMRDYGPLFVKSYGGGLRIVDTRYYYGRFLDDVMPTRMASWWNLPVSRPEIDLEGGNFQSDGAGKCITTEWAVDQNDFRGYGKADVRQIFSDYMGCDETFILPQLAYEGTGHVDMYATITGKNQVIVGDYPVSEDSVNAGRLDTAAAMLEQGGFTVRRIPMPTNADGAFRSYTNSLALSGAVLVPVYDDDTRFESEAFEVFKQAYPGRAIIPIDSTNIIQWSGAVHCVTMTVAE